MKRALSLFLLLCFAGCTGNRAVLSPPSGGVSGPSESASGNSAIVQSVAGFLSFKNGMISPFDEEPPGTRIVVHFDDPMLLSQGPKLLLSGNGDYQANGGDLLEFISQGGGVWKELSRQVQCDSHVDAAITVTATIPQGATVPILYDAVSEDCQGEFSKGSGTFIAHQDGIYAVSASASTATATWLTGEFCRLEIVQNGTIILGESNPMPALTGVCSKSLQASLRMRRGDTLRIAYENGKGDMAMLQTGTLNISRIRR